MVELVSLDKPSWKNRRVEVDALNSILARRHTDGNPVLKSERDMVTAWTVAILAVRAGFGDPDEILGGCARLTNEFTGLARTKVETVRTLELKYRELGADLQKAAELVSVCRERRRSPRRLIRTASTAIRLYECQKPCCDRNETRETARTFWFRCAGCFGATDDETPEEIEIAGRIESTVSEIHRLRYVVEGATGRILCPGKTNAEDFTRNVARFEKHAEATAVELADQIEKHADDWMWRRWVISGWRGVLDGVAQTRP